MKKTKLIVGIIIAAVGLLGLSGIGSSDSKGLYAITCALIMAVGALFIFLHFNGKKKHVESLKAEAAEAEQKRQEKKETTEKLIASGAMNYNLFSEFSNGAILKYEYEENLCIDKGAISAIKGNGGKPVEFVKEPANQYDKNAVAVHLNGAKIGYVFKGTVQDMINDYLRRGWKVAGYINKFSEQAEKATYKVGFYRPLDSFDHQDFEIINYNKKADDVLSRRDNLVCLSAGDYVSAEENDGVFVVYNEAFEEVGELSARFNDFAGAKLNLEKVVGVMTICDENDEGDLEAKAEFYLI